MNVNDRGDSPSDHADPHSNQMRGTFASFLPRVDYSEPKVVELTAMFADLTGFGGLSRRLVKQYKDAAAEKLSHIVNAAVGIIVDAVHENGGDVIKFLGDAVFAVFPDANDALRAAANAQENLKRCPGAASEFSKSDRPLRASIGLSTERFFAATFGQERKEVAVLGSRDVYQAENLAKPGQIVAAGSTLDALNEAPRCISIGETEFYAIADLGPITPAQQRPPAAAPRPDPPLEYLRCFVPEFIHAALERRGDVEPRFKNVTTLFANVHFDFTSLVENPALFGRINTLFTDIARIIARNRGFLNKFYGNFMAMFPDDLHNHEEKAIRTALDIVNYVKEYRASGPSLNVSVGVETGRCFVATVGGPSRREYTGIGDSIIRAYRLASKTRDKIWTTERLLKRLEAKDVPRFFGCVKLGKATLKARGETALVREVTGYERPRLKTRPWTELVGRERELAQIEEALGNIGCGCVLTISGEPGIGKSRLLYELEQRVKRLAQYRLFKVEADPSTTSAPFSLAKELVGKVVGLDDGARGTMPDTIQAFCASRALDCERELLALFGFPTELDSFEPEARKRRVFDAAKRALLANASSVYVLEDLHWADERSAELIRELASNIPQSIMLASTFRREFDSSTLQATTEIELGFMKRRHFVDFARAVLGKPVGKELADFVCDHSGGNPFFARQIIDHLVDTWQLRDEGECFGLTKALDELDVPQTVEDLVSARIENLPDAAKQAIYASSVIGPEFRLYELIRLVGAYGEASPSEAAFQDFVTAAIQPLLDRNLIVQLDESKHIYQTNHATTTETAYKRLSENDRKRLHGKLVRIIEQDPELKDKQDTLDVVARKQYHAYRSNEHDKAADYSRKAGELSISDYGNDQAIEFCTQGIEAVDRAIQRDGETKERLEHKMTMLFIRGQVTIINKLDRKGGSKDCEEALGIANENDNDLFRFLSLDYIGLGKTFMRCMEEMLSSRSPILDAFDTMIDNYKKALEILESAFCTGAQLDNSRVEHALALLQQRGFPSVEIMRRNVQAMAYYRRGDIENALSNIDRAYDLAKEKRNLDFLWRICYDAARIYADVDEAKAKKMRAEGEEYLEMYCAHMTPSRKRDS